VIENKPNNRKTQLLVNLFLPPLFVSLQLSAFSFQLK